MVIAAAGENWSGWQEVASNPLVQARWDQNFVIWGSAMIQFKADEDVRVRYVATIEKQDHTTDRVSGTTAVSRIGGGTAGVGDRVRIQGVTATVIK